MFRHVLVAVDGSPGAEKAAEFARNLALATGARLTALIVIEPPGAFVFGPLDLVAPTASFPGPEALGRAQAMLDRLHTSMPGHAEHSRVEFGRAADKILDVAKELDVDLIVVGARGLGAVDRFLVGSTSEKVVRGADRPVTVVR